MEGEEEKWASVSSEIVYGIEELLARSSMLPVEERDTDKIYNKMTVVELSHIAPEMDWKSYFSDIGAGLPEEIIVCQPEFMKTCARLIGGPSFDNLKIYFLYRLINASASVLGDDFQNLEFEFEKNFSGAKEIKPRWKRCGSGSEGGVGGGLGKKIF